MIENSMQQAVGQNSPDVTLRPTTVAMCPMAKMCERMEKARSGSLLMLAGALLIGLGVLIFIEPRVVVWLVGAVAILMGIMFFMMARFIGRLHKPSFQEASQMPFYLTDRETSSDITTVDSVLRCSCAVNLPTEG